MLPHPLVRKKSWLTAAWHPVLHSVAQRPVQILRTESPRLRMALTALLTHHHSPGPSPALNRHLVWQCY